MHSVIIAKQELLNRRVLYPGRISLEKRLFTAMLSSPGVRTIKCINIGKRIGWGEIIVIAWQENVPLAAARRPPCQQQLFPQLAERSLCSTKRVLLPDSNASITGKISCNADIRQATYSDGCTAGAGTRKPLEAGALQLGRRWVQLV